MASDASLVATLGANLDQFGNEMKRADAMADDAIKGIESRFANSNPSYASALDRMKQDSLSRAEETGGAIGAAIGVGLVGAVGLAIKKIHDLIGSLSEIGDRSDDLRLNVNLLQALSVAAGQAGVSQNQLNSALDRFTSVSKKTEDDAKNFYKALTNINGAYAEQFKNAGSQQERLNIISNALKSTSDEVKRAQLSQEAFGTDIERVTNLLGAGSDGIQEYINQVHRLGLEIDESAVKKAQQARSDLSLLSRVLTDELSSSLASLIPSFSTLIPYFERLAALARDLTASLLASSDAAKPSETLEREANVIASQVQELLAQRDRLVNDTPTIADAARDAIRRDIEKAAKELFDFNLSLTETTETIDAQIAALSARLSAISGVLSAKSGGGSPLKVTVGAGAFKPRPSLSGDSDSGGKDAFERQVDSINKHIASLEADTEAVGKTAAEHERLRTEAALTEALLRSGIEINDEYAEKIDKIAAAAAKAKGDLERAKTAFQGINDAARFAGNQLVDVLDRAMQKGAKFGDIMSDVLRNVSKQLLSAAITGEGAFAKLLGFNSTTGGVGGLLGALIPKAAGGMTNSSGGLTWVGERGPELVSLPKGSQVFPNEVSTQMVSGGGGVSIAMSNDFRGVDPASVARVEAKLNEMQRTLPSQVARIVPDLRRRSARGF